MTETRLTQDQAYRAMLRFLDGMYRERPSERLGDLLSDSQLGLWMEGGSADPAALQTWREIAGGSQTMTPDEAFDVMRAYVNGFYARVHGLSDSPLRDDRLTPELRTDWKAAVQAMAGPPNSAEAS